MLSLDLADTPASSSAVVATFPALRRCVAPAQPVRPYPVQFCTVCPEIGDRTRVRTQLVEATVVRTSRTWFALFIRLAKAF